MTKGFVRDATWADVPLLAADLRCADRAELKAFSGLSHHEAISEGLRAVEHGGSARVACLPNGLPAAIFGVVPTPVEGLGAVWMVATNGFQALHRQFLREGGQELQRLGSGYRALFNLTDARNHVHHRWLQWVGFTIIKRHEEYGREGRPFLEFVRIME